MGTGEVSEPGRARKLREEEERKAECAGSQGRLRARQRDKGRGGSGCGIEVQRLPARGHEGRKVRTVGWGAVGGVLRGCGGPSRAVQVALTRADTANSQPGENGSSTLSLQREESTGPYPLPPSAKPQGCTASAGIGPNKLVARLATKKAKPDGQLRVSPEEAEAFVAMLPVGDLPGVGGRLCEKLAVLGIKTCADVLSFRHDLRHLLGEKTGAQLREFSAGVQGWL